MNENGLIRTDGDSQEQVEIPVGLIVTEKELVFGAVDSDGSNAVSFGYGELASVDVTENALVFTTSDGVHWRFVLPDSVHDGVDGAIRHLSWVGDVRNHIRSTVNDVELATGQIRALRDNHEWGAAVDTYRKIRTQLDAVICMVQTTTPLSDGTLSPELANLDRQLESACARLYIDRSRSQLELVSHLLECQDYEQAETVFGRVIDYYDHAQCHSEEIRRADAFQFGRQRTLVDDLEALRWDIDTTAAEPVQQAKEATVRAETAETLSAEIDHLETALDRYRGIQTVAWYGYLANDAEAIQETSKQIGTQLIDCHERAARTKWNDGSRLETENWLEDAIEACTAATEHLERAHELAETFDPQRVSAFESRLNQMFDILLGMQDTARGSGTVKNTNSKETADTGNDVTADNLPSVRTTDSHQRPTLDDVAGLDLHHDITLDLDGESRPLNNSQRTDKELPADVDGLDDARDDTDNTTTEDETHSEPYQTSNRTE
ncbi:hypothetical protein ACFQJ7_16230 [Halovenus rubra]|uniref:Uncharacterized protein n=2 Tax=Halovenus rubra TaxID=869890 RepID=A0ABD5X8R9_9EURY|nr:hypothetical protein [Halovenus rubra]